MDLLHKNVGDIVADDYRTAAVFSAHKIDFCCKGNRPLGTVCQEANIPTETILRDLETAATSPNATGGIDYQTLPLDLLIDFIEKKYHRYIREKTPVLMGYLEKVATVHGKAYPELLEIFRLFAASAQDLEAHMLKEENVLFPFIRQLVQKDGQAGHTCFQCVETPISVMRMEHETEGDRFRRIAELSNQYTPPAGACNTFKVSYAMLQDFEAQLHLHIHLENNILFPKAIALEQSIVLVG